MGKVPRVKIVSKTSKDATVRVENVIKNDRSKSERSRSYLGFGRKIYLGQEEKALDGKFYSL